LKSTGSRLQLLQTCVKPDHCAAMTSTNTQSTAHTNPAHVFQATGQPGSALARRCRRRSSPGGAVLGGACDVADRKLVRTSASLFDSADDTAKCCSDGTCMRKLCETDLAVSTWADGWLRPRVQRLRHARLLLTTTCTRVSATQSRSRLGQQPSKIVGTVSCAVTHGRDRNQRTFQDKMSS
jgi:hypothetical protein